MDKRWLRERIALAPPMLIDVSLALVLGLIGAAQLISDRHPFGEPRGGPRPGPGPGPGPGPFPRSHEPLDYVFLGLCAGFLVLRRRSPFIALAGATAFAAAFVFRDQPFFAVQLIVLVAIYSAVADSNSPRLVSILMGAGAAGTIGLAIFLTDAGRPDSLWAMDAAWAAAAIFLGDSVRSRRGYTAELERSREEEARRRVADERLQIARELHDVVGHNISLINVQASAGAHVLYKDEAKALETFANIRDASHETLQELRSMVSVLREPLGDDSRAPTVGLSALDQLIGAIVDAGQTVEVSVTGAPEHLSSVVDLSAYRILQEALTNTIRHAPKSKVKVSVDYRDRELVLNVTNGPGDDNLPRLLGGGHGVIGMRERAAAIGGRLYAEPQPDGGFQVKAVLPAPKTA